MRAISRRDFDAVDLARDGWSDEFLLDTRKVVADLAEVLDAIGDPELAWAFLTQEWSFEDDVAVPLEMLKAGRTAAVIGAAPGFGATFS